MSDTIKRLEIMKARLPYQVLDKGLNEDFHTLDAAIAELRGLGAGETVAWLIRYDAGGGHESRVAHLHNAVADYRQIDPKATSTPLYASPRAFDSFGEPRGCPTPGACSCPGAVAMEREAVAENAALREKLAEAEGKFRDAQTVVAGLSDLLRKEGMRAEKAEAELAETKDALEKASRFAVGCDHDNSGLRADLEAAEAELAALKAETVDAWETAVDWGGYANAYFQAKYGYEGDVKKLEAARTRLNLAHTDHPARHFDRTCPACQAEIYADEHPKEHDEEFICPKCGIRRDAHECPAEGDSDEK